MTKSKLIIGTAALTAAAIAGGGIGAGIMAAAPVSAGDRAAIETAYSERLAGIVQVKDLPPGVDRSQARAAEFAGKAFQYADSRACGALTVRFPDRRVIVLRGAIDAEAQAIAYGAAPRDCTAESAQLRWLGEPIHRRPYAPEITAAGYVAAGRITRDAAVVVTPRGEAFPVVTVPVPAAGFALNSLLRRDRTDPNASGAGTVAPPTGN